MPSEYRVHIVDDDPSMLDSTAVLLQALGYDAVPWATPGDFLVRAELSRGDCLLLDVRMPGIGGFELITLLRGRGDMLPVVLVTGHCDDMITAMAQAAGVIRLIEKPYRFETLEEAVRAAAEAARSLG